MIYSRDERIRVAWVALSGGGGGQEGTGNGRDRDRSETEKKEQEMNGRNVWEIVREHLEKRQNS